MYKLRKTLFALGILAASTGACAAEQLRFAVGVPPQVHYNKELFTPWSEKVAAESNGTLDIKMFYAGALGHPGEFLEAVEVGAADIVIDIASYYPGQFATSAVASMPFLIKNPVDGSRALWNVYENGGFGNAFDGLKMLAISTPPAAMILTTDKAITSPEEMAGLKIAATGKISPSVAKSVSAAPISIPIYELYQALSRSTVDGAITYFTGIPPFKLNEVGKHYLDVPLGGSMMLVYMSQERFDALPADAQAAIEKNSGLALSEAFGKVWASAEQVGRKMATDSGGTIITPSEEELAAWQTSLQPIIDDWAASVDGGQAVLDAMHAELDK